MSALLEALRTRQPLSVIKQAVAANGTPGYWPEHKRDGGECAVTLDDLPVLARYTLTTLGAEVEEISINGHTVAAGYFAADTLNGWARDCERSREAAGWL